MSRRGFPFSVIVKADLLLCIADYRDHAQEANLPLPDKITLFHKPRTSLTGPWPAEVPIPRCVHQEAEQSDYESELCVIIGKDCRDVTEEQALDYVLGYTAANDISARKAQFETSQWSRSKGFDAACPIGEMKRASLPAVLMLMLRHALLRPVHRLGIIIQEPRSSCK